MADLKTLEDRLKQIGCNFRFWGRSELRELANVLMPNEIVEHCVNGQYSGGFAMLVATDQRVLLIDKKPMYLTLEDTRYDMVSEVDFNHRLLDANIYICTPNKSLRFVAYNQGRLRKLFHFVQMRVMEIRSHYQQAAQQFAVSQTAAAQPLATAVPAGSLPLQQLEPYFTGQLAAYQMSASSAPEPAPVTQQMAFQSSVAPIISAYTRLPMMSRQRRFLGSRAINTALTSLYSGSQRPQA